MDNNVPEHPSKGVVFLFVLSTIVWIMIGLSNEVDSIIGLLFGAALMGAMSAFVLTILYVLMKRMFKW